MYLSPQEQIFTGSPREKTLIWHLDNIEIGDWTAGPNNDGSYTFYHQVQATKVGI